MASGNWSGSIPSCERKKIKLLRAIYCTLKSCLSLYLVVDCGPLNPMQVGGLSVDLMQSVFNTTVRYSCREEGYELMGEAERMCGADGRWSGDEPRCEC